MSASAFAEVMLWDRVIGAVSWDATRGLGAFEYARDFQSSGIEVAPQMMPLRAEVFRFPDLARESFQGLPGMLADCLPDKFGNLLIDQWLAREGREPGSFNPVERLCYLGTRAMGALEFRPALRRGRESSQPLQIKFDGVSGNRDKEATDGARGYGLVEYAYHHMAAAGIEMSRCRLLEEGGAATS